MESTDSNAIKDPRVRAAIEHYLLDLESTTPPNTLRNYKPKQKEWQDWCEQNWPAIPAGWPPQDPIPSGQQLPGDLVDEGKLLLFMKEAVVSRAPRKGKRVAHERKHHLEEQEAKKAAKRRKYAPGDTIYVGGKDDSSSSSSDSDFEIFESQLKLQYNSVRGYVSAIQKLYDEQKTRGINPAPRPQGVALKALKRSILATMWSKKRKEYTDRGVGTLRDVYSPAQIPDHTAVAWAERDRISIGSALRTQVDFLFGNHMLLRSSNRRPMELADCFCLGLPNEGLKTEGFTTKALIVVMNCGKTNQHGRMEYGAALRHRDPRSCLIGALAFFFFWRWQAEKAEKFPVFGKSEDWYGIKVLRRSAKEPKAPLSYQTARDWTSRFYEKAGIKVSKVSHAPRVAGTQNADIAGVAEGQIRRAGRWNNGDQMTGCYLTSLPFEFMRAVADFDPEWSGTYFVPRATVRPPASLLAQVWPELDKWKIAHDDPGSKEAVKLGVEPNTAAGAFLELLEWLREVLLQDAVFLREHYPFHPIFEEPVFRCSEFAAFAVQIKDACKRAQEVSHVTAIQKAVPVVAAQLRTVAAQQLAAEQLAQQRYTELMAASQILATKMDDLTGGSFTVTWTPRRSKATLQWEVHAGHEPRQQRRRVSRETTPTPLARPVHTTPPTQTAPAPKQGQGGGEASQSVAERSQPPSYKLPRAVKTVQDLLRLWRHGLGGMPSVDGLERDWGTRWRPSSEKQYFSTRKMIIDEVARRAAAQHIAEDVVAKQMDAERDSNSLDKVFKSIRNDRKARN